MTSDRSPAVRSALRLAARTFDGDSAVVGVVFDLRDLGGSPVRRYPFAAVYRDADGPALYGLFASDPVASFALSNRTGMTPDWRPSPSGGVLAADLT